MNALGLVFFIRLTAEETTMPSKTPSHGMSAIKPAKNSVKNVITSSIVHFRTIRGSSTYFGTLIGSLISDLLDSHDTESPGGFVRERFSFAGVFLLDLLLDVRCHNDNRDGSGNTPEENGDRVNADWRGDVEQRQHQHQCQSMTGRVIQHRAGIAIGDFLYCPDAHAMDHRRYHDGQ